MESVSICVICGQLWLRCFVAAFVALRVLGVSINPLKSPLPIDKLINAPEKTIQLTTDLCR